MLRAIQNRKGFTLVELLIVVAIIGILAAIAIPQFAAYREKAYCSSIKSDLANLAISEEAYFTDHNVYGAIASLTGFKATTGVVLNLGASSVGSVSAWTATGSHANCNGGGTIYTWDSTQGGLQ